MLGFERRRSINGQNAVQNQTPPATNFFPRMSHCPAFGIDFTSLRRTLFRDNRVDGICPENPVPKALHFSVAPSLRSKLFPRLGPAVFQDNRIDGNCPKKNHAISQLCTFASLPPSGSSQANYNSTLHNPCALDRRSRLAPFSGTPPKLFRFTVHRYSASQSITLLRRFRLVPPSPCFTVHPRCRSLQSSLQAISTFHSPSTLVRRSRPAELAPSYFHASLTVQPSSAQAISTLHSPFTTLPSRSLQRRPAKLFPRFTIHPSSSGVPASLPPAKLPPSYFQRFTVDHARPAFPPRSLQRNSPQAISTLHSPSALVRRSCLAPAELLPSYFQRFTVHPRSSDASCSLPPAELPPNYFHACQSIHARPALRSRSLQRRSPQNISKVFPDYFHAFYSARARAFLACFLPSFPLSFLPFFLPCSSGSSVSLPLRRRKLNENPSIGDAFVKKIQHQAQLYNCQWDYVQVFSFYFKDAPFPQPACTVLSCIHISVGYLTCPRCHCQQSRMDRTLSLVRPALVH